MKRQRTEQSTFRYKISKTEQQLQYEQRNPRAVTIAALEETIKGHRSKLAEVEQQAKRIASAAKALQKESEAEVPAA